MASSSPSIYDLAKELNVSVSTVSRALSDHPSISKLTKKRVSKLAQERNYQPNQVAAALSKGQGNLLGVLVPHIDGYFFGSIVRGIETTARQAGYHVLICQSYEDAALQREAFETMLNARVAGILVSTALSTQDLTSFAAVRERGLPLVLFDRNLPALDASAVIIDDYRGAYQMTEHLLDQGARRVAHLAGPQLLELFRNRLRGYQDALLHRGLPLDSTLVQPEGLTIEGGTAGMEALLQLPQPPDAVFAATDFACLGAMQVLKKHGVRIPEQVLLGGFGNEPFTTYVEPALTSVSQLTVQMGEAAVELLLSKLSEPVSAAPPHSRVLKPELIVRQSSQWSVM